MSFSNEEVVAQSDVHLTGTTVETLIIEFDQAKYEEAISSGSLCPKAMRKIHKVSEETKAPVVANAEVVTAFEIQNAEVMPAF